MDDNTNDKLPEGTAEQENNATDNISMKFGQIIPVDINKQMKTSYIDYAMSVIISRAIPEIDGFKPSHRKLLYCMYKMGLLNGQRTKSANIVGQTMHYNPHGDAAIYETMVRLTRDNEALNVPFVDSKGNFGKVYSRDMAYAASRYTEATLIRAMEEKGIGRPSTYAPTITTITAHDYVVKEGKYLSPTPLGEVVTDLMREHFADIVDLKFTNHMEAELDEIERGYVFYACERGTDCGFITWDVPTKDYCPACGKTMFKKSGRGAPKPFCVNEECVNFVPEDQRGYRKKSGTQKDEGAEPSAAKKTAATKKTTTKKTTAAKNPAAKKTTTKKPAGES